MMIFPDIFPPWLWFLSHTLKCSSFFVQLCVFIEGEDETREESFRTKKSSKKMNRVCLDVFIFMLHNHKCIAVLLIFYASFLSSKVHALNDDSLPNVVNCYSVNWGLPSSLCCCQVCSPSLSLLLPEDFLSSGLLFLLLLLPPVSTFNLSLRLLVRYVTSSWI